MNDWLDINNYSHHFFNTTYFSIVSFIALIIMGVLWNFKNKSDTEATEIIKCKHVISVSLIGYIFALAIFCGDIFISLFSLLWLCVKSFFCLFYIVGSFIWHLAGTCFHYIISFATMDYYSIPLYMFVIIFLISLFIINYIAVILMGKFENKIDESEKSVDYYDQWFLGVSYRISKIFDQDDLNRGISWLMNVSGYKCPIKYIDNHIQYILARDYKKKFEYRKYTKPENSVMKEMAKDIADNCMFFPEISERIFRDTEVIAEVEAFKKKMREEIRLRRERENKKIEGKFHKTIEFIANFSTNGLILIVSFLWKEFKALCYNIFVFFCFVWELLKAKKKNACPYIKFKD